MKTFSIQRVETFNESTDVKVTVNGKEETYSLVSPPALKLALVQREKENILQRLDLNCVIANLDNANGLLFVAHNALAGTHIQSKISGLQKELQDLCIKSILAITSFQENIEDILGRTTEAYRYLFKCKESLALKRLQQCCDYAADMQEQCRELSAGFDSMAKKTQAALEASQDEQAVQYNKMVAIRNELNKMQADQDARVKNSELLQAELEETAQLYEDAKQKEEAAAKEERTIRLVSAITGGLSGIVGGVASAIGSSLSRPGINIGVPASGGAGSGTGSPGTAAGGPGSAGAASGGAGGSGAASGGAAGTGAQSKLTPEEQALLDQKQAQRDKLADLKRQQVENQTKKNTLLAEAAQIKADIEEAPKKIEALRASLAEVEKDTAMDAEKKAAEVKKLTAQIETKENDLPAMKRALAEKQAQADALSTHEADCTVAIEAANGILNNLNAQMQNLSDKSAQALQEAKNESKTLLKQKFELEKQNREMLSTMAKFARLIEGTTAQGNQAETAVQTLQVAVLCLKQIAVTLSNAALFWSSVERFCRKLAQSKLTEDIKDLADFTPEERLDEYRSPEFVLTLISYLCSWVALADVCDKYLDAARQSREQIQANIMRGYLPEESWKLAVEQAHELLDSVNAQIEVSDQNQKRLQDAQDAL